jgi:hypothetical protein
MPDLLQSLLKQDIGHLRIIAGLWGLELESNETEAAREELAASLLDFELAGEILESLPPNTRAALDAMIAKEGRIPWAEFTRQFGEIREMGAGRRDRERPHLRPASTAEALFYRGFLARAFFDTPSGPQEFAYIPDDLFELVLSHKEHGEQEEAQKETPVNSTGHRKPVPPSRTSPEPVSHRSSVPPGPRPQAGGQTTVVLEARTTGEQIVPSEANPEALGRPASPGEKGREIPANDHILDDATTLLAALRMGKLDWQSDSRLLELLTAAQLIRKNVPQAEAVKQFLEAPREAALKLLTDAWQASQEFNELRQLPHLIFEGEWKNQPQETREFLLNVLDVIPEGKWWSLNALVREIFLLFYDLDRNCVVYV